MPFQAFTSKYKGIVGQIISTCEVSDFIEDLSQDFSMTTFHALWDTGATCSAISKDAAEKLNLEPVSKVTVSHADGQSMVNVYDISLALPNETLFQFVRVTECTLSGFDLLIGMDIISEGDFSISNKDGKTTFSFRIPSYKEIDFVSELDEIKIKNPLSEPV